MHLINSGKVPENRTHQKSARKLASMKLNKATKSKSLDTLVKNLVKDAKGTKGAKTQKNAPKGKPVSSKPIKVKPYTLPKGCQWFVAIGSKGVALFPASMTSKGEIFSRHDGLEFVGVTPDANGRVVLPWDKTNAWLGVKAYVADRKAAVQLLPLTKALASGAVKAHKLAVPSGHNQTEVYAPKGWSPVQQAPKYLGEQSSRGHVEPRVIDDRRKDAEGARNSRHVDHLTFAAAK